jgi:hypothetical protein
MRRFVALLVCVCFLWQETVFAAGGDLYILKSYKLRSMQVAERTQDDVRLGVYGKPVRYLERVYGTAASFFSSQTLPVLPGVYTDPYYIARVINRTIVTGGAAGAIRINLMPREFDPLLLKTLFTDGDIIQARLESDGSIDVITDEKIHLAEPKPLQIHPSAAASGQPALFKRFTSYTGILLKGWMLVKAGLPLFSIMNPFLAGGIIAGFLIGTFCFRRYVLPKFSLKTQIIIVVSFAAMMLATMPLWAVNIHQPLSMIGTAVRQLSDKNFYSNILFKTAASEHGGRIHADIALRWALKKTGIDIAPRCFASGSSTMGSLEEGLKDGLKKAIRQGTINDSEIQRILSTSNRWHPHLKELFNEASRSAAHHFDIHYITQFISRPPVVILAIVALFLLYRYIRRRYARAPAVVLKKLRALEGVAWTSDEPSRSEERSKTHPEAAGIPSTETAKGPPPPDSDGSDASAAGWQELQQECIVFLNSAHSLNINSYTPDQVSSTPEGNARIYYRYTLRAIELAEEILAMYHATKGRQPLVERAMVGYVAILLDVASYYTECAFNLNYVVTMPMVSDYKVPSGDITSRLVSLAGQIVYGFRSTFEESLRNMTTSLRPIIVLGARIFGGSSSEADRIVEAWNSWAANLRGKIPDVLLGAKRNWKKRAVVFRVLGVIVLATSVEGIFKTATTFASSHTYLDAIVAFLYLLKALVGPAAVLVSWYLLKSMDDDEYCKALWHKIDVLKSRLATAEQEMEGSVNFDTALQTEYVHIAGVLETERTADKPSLDLLVVVVTADTDEEVAALERVFSKSGNAFVRDDVPVVYVRNVNEGSGAAMVRCVNYLSSEEFNLLKQSYPVLAGKSLEDGTLKAAAFFVDCSVPSVFTEQLPVPCLPGINRPPTAIELAVLVAYRAAHEDASRRDDAQPPTGACEGFLYIGFANNVYVGPAFRRVGNKPTRLGTWVSLNQQSHEGLGIISLDPHNPTLIRSAYERVQHESIADKLRIDPFYQFLDWDNDERHQLVSSVCGLWISFEQKQDYKNFVDLCLQLRGRDFVLGRDFLTPLTRKKACQNMASFLLSAAPGGDGVLVENPDILASYYELLNIYFYSPLDFDSRIDLMPPQVSFHVKLNGTENGDWQAEQLDELSKRMGLSPSTTGHTEGTVSEQSAASRQTVHSQQGPGDVATDDIVGPIEHTVGNASGVSGGVANSAGTHDDGLSARDKAILEALRLAEMIQARRLSMAAKALMVNDYFAIQSAIERSRRRHEAEMSL